MKEMSKRQFGKKLHFHFVKKVHFDVDIYNVEYILTNASVVAKEAGR